MILSLTFVIHVHYSGFTADNISNDIFEHVEQYDAHDSPHPECGINTTVNAGQECTLSIPITRDLEPPIMIYYEIEGFHQNHRTYSKSRDVYQVSQLLHVSPLPVVQLMYFANDLSNDPRPITHPQNVVDWLVNPRCPFSSAV